MKKNLFKRIITFSFITLCMLAPISLVSCKKNNNAPKKQVSFESAYDTSALGGIGLLNSSNASSQVKLANEKSDNIILSDADKKDILANLAIAQNMIDGGIVRSEVKPSDKEGYEFFYTLSAADITGENKVYKFYYNRTLVTEEEEAEKVEKAKKEEAEEEEQEFILEGIVIMGEVEYKLRGEQTIEQDEKEFEFVVSLTDTNYVTIEHSSSNEETEFEYSLYKDGKVVYETEVEYETDENGEIEIEFETETPEGALEYSYEFYTNEEGSFVKVELEKNKVKTTALIKVTLDEAGKPNYEFIEK